MNRHLIDCKLNVLATVVGLAMTLPSLAIEKPSASASPEGPGQDQLQQDLQPEQEEQTLSVAWIGLGGAPVSETLAKHLGLEPGVGLTIHHVLEGDPADKAGIEIHDVLVEFDGQRVGDFDVFRDAVRAKKPGDEVEIALIKQGKLQTRKVVLAERKITLGQARQSPLDMEANPLWRGMGDLPQADRDRMREMMKRNLDELSKQLQRNGEIEFDMKKFIGPDDVARFKGPDDLVPAPGKEGEAFQFNAQASMTVMDDEGSVTMKVINGAHEVIVKDKQGKVLFEGPYDTPQDKAAVPDDVRQRLDKIDFFKDMRKGFKFDIIPQRDKHNAGD